jgi:hypothetical protein
LIHGAALTRKSSRMSKIEPIAIIAANRDELERLVASDRNTVTICVLPSGKKLTSRGSKPDACQSAGAMVPAASRRYVSPMPRRASS